MAKGWKVDGLAPDRQALECARSIVLTRFKEALSHTVGVYADSDIEDVHNYRVSLRRLWAALKVFEPCFEDSQELRRLLKKTRKLARRLGAVRDLDVMIEKLKEQKAQNQNEAALFTLLIEDCRRRRAKRFIRLVKMMKRMEAKQFEYEFVRFFSHGNEHTEQSLRQIPTLGSEVL
ncbi:MAG: CHAD domain-containing protein [Candidatus Bathyarchaeia archaeon]